MNEQNQNRPDMNKQQDKSLQDRDRANKSNIDKDKAGSRVNPDSRTSRS